MTREQATEKIVEKLNEILGIMQELDPNTSYLTLAYIKDERTGEIRFQGNNEYYPISERENPLRVDFWKDDEGIHYD